MKHRCLYIGPTKHGLTLVLLSNHFIGAWLTGNISIIGDVFVR